MVFLGSALVVGGVLLALLFVFQRKLIYPAPSAQLPTILPAGVEKIEFDDSYLLYLPARLSAQSQPISQPSAHDNNPGQTAGPVVIYSHGNGELAFQWMGEFDQLRDAGIAIALVEYPGYAGAPGKPSLDTIRSVMQNAYDAITSRPEIDQDRVIAYGRSIGGGAACLLLEERPVAAVVLESTFSRLATLVGEKYYPSALLLDRYDNAEILATHDVPVFLYHGTQDRVVPLHHAKILHEAARHSSLEIAECDHNNCARPEAQVLAFLRQWNIL